MSNRGSRTTGRLLDLQALPPELTANLSNTKDLEDDVSVVNILKTMWQQKMPTMAARQSCRDVIHNVRDTDPTLAKEMNWGAKMALCAYALPYYWSFMVDHLYESNEAFGRYLEGLVAETTATAYDHMTDVVEGKVDVIDMTHKTMGGFYLRTPIQIWNRNRKRVYQIPSWEHRNELLHYFMIGHVNVYVLKHMLAADQYELLVLFRGTSNEFNAIPQYGSAMRSTQIYRLPQYDPLTNTVHPEGSETRPLYYYYYCDMLRQVEPLIFWALDQLGWDHPHCQRILVCGHSMGGALTLTWDVRVDDA